MVDFFDADGSAEGRTADSPGKDSPGRTRYRARPGGFVVAEHDGRQQLYDLFGDLQVTTLRQRD
jgi:hypothetical protein